MSELKILSQRAYQHWPSYDVVYEWEDAFLKYGFKMDILEEKAIFKLGKMRYIGKFAKKVYKYIFKPGISTLKSCGLRFIWIMDASEYKYYCSMKAVPIFLDFQETLVEEIHHATEKLPYYWVTCLDIYNKLLDCGSKNVQYMPLSISDIYVKDFIPQKCHDVIQFGRKNSVLHKYMLEYCEKHPNIEYIYQTEDGSLTYYSTVNGNIGKLDKRDNYMRLMSECKVSLVSSPGKDNSRSFGQVDFITPRFYESAINYCYMIGRYTNNEEARKIGIPFICPSIETFEEFEKLLTEYLSMKNFSKKNVYDEFIRNNVTSKRVKDFLEKIRL